MLFLSRSGLLIMEGKVQYDIQTEPQSTPFTTMTTSSVSGIKHVLSTCTKSVITPIVKLLFTEINTDYFTLKL